jgi:hypothetical protein
VVKPGNRFPAPFRERHITKVMTMKTIEEILAPKPEVRPRIYAYAIADAAHKGLLRVGQTTRDVKRRIAEQLKTAAFKNYRSNSMSPPSAATAPSSPTTR